MGGVTKIEILKSLAEKVINTGMRSSFWEEWKYQSFNHDHEIVAKYIDMADPWTILHLIYQIEKLTDENSRLKRMIKEFGEL